MNGLVCAETTQSLTAGEIFTWQPYKKKLMESGKAFGQNCFRTIYYVPLIHGHG